MKRLILLLTLFTCALSARQPYQAGITDGASTGIVSAPNLIDLSNDLKTVSLENILPTYTPDSPLAIGIDLRGIAVISSFAANSTTLVLTVPQAGLSQSFTGSTRDESIVLMRSYLRDGGTRHRLLRAYAKYSPIDPIAGNPNSLMAQMAQADYLTGRLTPLSGCDCCWTAQPVPHLYQAGINAGWGYSHGYNTTAITIPLRYSYSPNRRCAFILDAPITYNANGGASSVYGSIGLGLCTPITHNWSLTPLLRGGAGGSLDLCTSGSFLTAGLLSNYNLCFNNYLLSITNYAGYITSTNLWLTGINFNYHLHNALLKNGLALTTCKGINFCGRQLHGSLTFIDSYFSGNLLYMNHYDEVGITFFTTGLNRRLCYDSLSLSFAYQFGQQGYTGYSANLTYQF